MNGFDVCKNLINSVKMEVFGNREKSGIFFFWLVIWHNGNYKTPFPGMKILAYRKYPATGVLIIISISKDYLILSLTDLCSLKASCFMSYWSRLFLEIVNHTTL